MFPCDNQTEITVRMNEEGDFIVEAVSSCKKAERYIAGLGPLTLADLTEKGISKVFSDFLASDMSANCLTPSGVLTAAWLEAGMIAKSYAKKGIPLEIELVE